MNAWINWLLLTFCRWWREHTHLPRFPIGQLLYLDNVLHVCTLHIHNGSGPGAPLKLCGATLLHCSKLMGKAVLSSGKRLRHGELCVTRSASLHRSASTGNMNRALTHANWEEKAPSRPWAQFAARKRSQRVEEKKDRPKRPERLRYGLMWVT